MDDDSRAIPAMIGGALLGAIAGYLFFSDRGRALRRQIEPALEEFAQEYSGFRHSIQRVVGVAAEGWAELARAPGGEQTPRTPRFH